MQALKGSPRAAQSSSPPPAASSRCSCLIHHKFPRSDLGRNGIHPRLSSAPAPSAYWLVNWVNITCLICRFSSAPLPPHLSGSLESKGCLVEGRRRVEFRRHFSLGHQQMTINYLNMACRAQIVAKCNNEKRGGRRRRTGGWGRGEFGL